jgi:hypothetical protein
MPIKNAAPGYDIFLARAKRENLDHSLAGLPEL